MKGKKEVMSAHLIDDIQLRQLFGQNLTKMRKQAKLSIGQLSELCQVNKSVLNRYERGLSHPRSKAFASLCRVLKCTPKEFYYEPSTAAIMEEVSRKLSQEVELVSDAIIRLKKDKSSTV